MAELIINIESNNKVFNSEERCNPDPEEIFYSDDETFLSDDEEDDDDEEENGANSNFNFEELILFKKLKKIRAETDKFVRQSSNKWNNQ